MRVKKFLQISRYLLLGCTVHVLYVVFYPTIELLKLQSNSKNRGMNQIFHAPLPTSSAQDIVLQNPDFLYSICGYDVSKSSLVLSSKVPANTYWSVSFYDIKTNNYRTINNTEFSFSEIKIRLAHHMKHLSNKNDGFDFFVESPQTKGVAIFRLLVKNKNDLDDLTKFQKSATCNSSSEKLN